MPRLLSKGGRAYPGDDWRVITALAWSFTWYGIPDLYNAVEMGFTGLCYRSKEERAQVVASMAAQGIAPALAALLMHAYDY
eukprot:5158571-Heterocapsa_arctica.AAC.1